MWEIEFYESASGECPTKEFLESLHKKDELPFVIREIDLLKEFGNQLRRPHADFLEDGIYDPILKRPKNIELIILNDTRENDEIH